MSKTTLASDKLFTPASFGAIEIKNRWVMAPMTRNQSPNNIPTATNVEYYRLRAKGGVGLIVSEGTTVGDESASGYPNVPAFAGEQALAGWRQIIEAVHAEGCKMIPQLWHVGSVRQPSAADDAPAIGPSPVVHPFHVDKKGIAPEAMTESKIADLITAFATAAKAALDLGFDGVELHGAHAYLIDQFFWSATNQRTDGYGGDLVARTRFAAELIAAVRTAVGPSFPVCFRYSQWKMGDYSHKMATNPDELAAFLDPLCDAGVDVFHCSTRRFADPEFDDSPLNLAGWTKKLTGKTTVTVGSIGLKGDFLGSFAGQPSAMADIDELIRRIDDDEFDFAAIGRALIADPEWPTKLAQGRESEITPFSPEHLKRYP